MFFLTNLCLIDCLWQQNVKDMFNPPRYKCSDVASYGCLSNRPPTHSPSIRDILCLFQTSSLIFYRSLLPLVCLVTALVMCAPQLCQKPIALNCDPLSLSLSFPFERMFIKFLSHISKRLIVRFGF